MRVSIFLMKHLFFCWCLYTLELARYRQVFLIVDTGFLKYTTYLSIESCRIHSRFMLSVGPYGRIQKDNCHSWNMRWLHRLIHFHLHTVQGRWYITRIFAISSLHDKSIPSIKHITSFVFFRLFRMWGMLPKATLLGIAWIFSRCCASLLNLAMQSPCSQCLTTLWVIFLKYCFLVLATSMYVSSIGILLNTLLLIMSICWLTWTLITLL
jgi:hypothetical protein